MGSPVSFLTASSVVSYDGGGAPPVAHGPLADVYAHDSFYKGLGRDTAEEKLSDLQVDGEYLLYTVSSEELVADNGHENESKAQAYVAVLKKYDDRFTVEHYWLEPPKLPSTRWTLHFNRAHDDSGDRGSHANGSSLESLFSELKRYGVLGQSLTSEKERGGDNAIDPDHQTIFPMDGFV